MSKCVICTSLGVATTNTTTPSEAFPFLCAQLGICSVTAGSSLCAPCHSMWEEVTLLYSNMQGLVNLMGRRVAQLRTKLKVPQRPDKDEGGKNAKRKRMSAPTTTTTTATKEAGPPESLLNWWYPSTTEDNSAGIGIEIVKSEPLEGLEESEDEMEMEDVEISPEDDNGESVEDKDDDEDPSYDPLASTSSLSCKPTPSTPGSSSSSKTTSNKKGDPPITTIMAPPGKFEVIPSWIPTRKGVIAKDGFVFYLNKKCVQKLSWHCSKKTCHVLLYTSDSEELDNLTLLMETGTHNHPPNEADIVKRRIMSRIMRDAVNSSDTPEEIFARHQGQLPADACKLPMFQNIKRAIRTVRGEKFPKVQREKKTEVTIYLPPPTE